MEAVYVGRNTSDGCRDFYFYTSKPTSWSSKVKLAMAGFQGYEYDVGEREDVEWSTYRNFLYPSNRDWETIKSRRVCDNLRKHNDPLTEVREIDHWIYFQNILQRESFCQKIKGLGYKIRKKSEPDSESDEFGLQVFHSDIPSPFVTLELFDTALECSGDYDGWETQVCT